MDDTTAQLILNELREMRTDMTNWRTESEGRLSIVETHVKTGITGNGQPSRIAVVEAKAADYEQNKYKAIGVAIAVSLLASLTAWPTVQHIWHSLFG